MQKIILSKEQIHELVFENKFKIEESQKYLSRCIDGRYQNNSTNPLSIPGGDAGELALILATANSYGFKVDLKKAYLILLDVIGGVNNFNFHTDDHNADKGVAGGCGHMAQLKIDPQAYNLANDQVDKIFQILDQAKKDGAKETVLKGSHLEGAVLMVKGDCAINPQYHFDVNGNKALAEVFVYHDTLVSQRHKEWTKKLYQEKAVELFDECDHEYLYEVLAETTELHLMETVRRLAKDLPIYLIEFKNKGDFAIIPL